jgi:uncharacterized protein (DUF58 family)
VPRPTRTAALLFGFAVLLEFLGRLVDSRPIAVAAAAALGAVIGDAALTPRLDGLALDCRGAIRMTAGVRTAVTFWIVQTSRRPRKLVPLVIDHDDPALGHIRALTGRITLERTGLRITKTPKQRGHWPAGGGTTVEAHSPLGGFVRRRRFPITAGRWVHPAPAAPVSLPDLAAPLTTSIGGGSRSGLGADFYGVREWRSGDAAATVHWRASARRNRLVVVERERPPAGPLIVMIGQPPEPDGQWELALSRAAATAVLACRAGRPVMLVGAALVTRPGSPGQVLDWFAELDSTGFDTAGDNRPTAPGATVLWVSGDPVPNALAAELRATGGTVIALGSSRAPGRRP